MLLGHRHLILKKQEGLQQEWVQGQKGPVLQLGQEVEKQVVVMSR